MLAVPRETPHATREMLRATHEMRHGGQPVTHVPPLSGPQRPSEMLLAKDPQKPVALREISFDLPSR